MMRKSMQRLCSLLAAVCLIVGFMPVIAVAEDEFVPGSSQNKIVARGTPDPNPPELISVSIDKTEVGVGETIKVTVDAKDDISGVYSGGYGGDMYCRFVNRETEKNNHASLRFSEESGKCEGTISISQYDLGSIYELDMVSISDNAGNQQYYYSKNHEHLEWIENVKLLPQELSFTVKEKTPDGLPPELVSVLVDKTKVEAPGIIRVTIDAKDDISGVYSGGYGGDMYCRFVNRETDKNNHVSLRFSEESGKCEGTISISQYDLGGVYELDMVSISDNAGNQQYYYSKNHEHLEWIENAKLLPQELSFTVKEKTPDGLPPELVSVLVDKTKVEAPGTIRVTVDARDDISGVYSGGYGGDMYCRFVNRETDKNNHVSLRFSEESGKCEGTISISQYDLGGVYELDMVSISDNAGNQQYYYSKNHEHLDWIENAKLLPQELYFAVQVDANTLITGTQNPNLADDIRALPDGAGASVSYESNPRISADVFEAIAGTDKTLMLEGNGIQWEFNGRDVRPEDAKALDLKVDINPIYWSNSPNADELQDKIQNENVYVLSFPDNGKLPGKAKIRIKADYAFREYMGVQNLSVYYYDNTDRKFVPVAMNVDVTDDGWLEFETDHNSDFIVTRGTITLTPSEDKPDVVIPDDILSSDTSSSSSSSGRSSKSSGSETPSRPAVKPLRASDVLPGIRAAVRGAVKRGETAGVTVRVPDISRISVTELSALQRALRTESLPVRLQFTRTGTSDSLTFSPLDISPAAAVQLGLRQGDAQVSALFGKYFKNRIRVLCFSQKGTFGTPVRVRTKLSLSGLDPKTLVFYHYDKEKNQYTLLTNPQYAVDQNGILSFTTETGDTLVITDAPLTKK